VGRFATKKTLKIPPTPKKTSCGSKKGPNLDRLAGKGKPDQTHPENNAKSEK